MSKFLTLLSREISAYFRSPIAYTVLVFFLVITGFNFYAGVSLLNQGVTDVTVVYVFFNTVFFWFPFVLSFPLLTMRLFSEEYKLGTIEPLMTAPIGDFQVVLAKYMGAMFFFVILWLPSLLYFVLFQWLTGQEAADAAGAWVGGYIMLLLMGMFYMAIGCLASALTRNQIVAAIMAFVAITMTFFMSMLTLLVLNISSSLRDFAAYFSAIDHMMEFSQGVFDTRPVVFYLSMTVFTLFLTFQVFQRRKWIA